MTATSFLNPGAALSGDQIATASAYLNSTREALIDSTAGLTRTQWEFQPAPRGWSIAQIVEHVFLVEEGVVRIVKAIEEAPEAPPDWLPSPIEQYILQEIPQRTNKVEAPPHLCPTHGWSGEEAISHFVSSREQNIRTLSSPFLRGRVVPHPICGLWDGYHWLLAAGAHSARHTAQIFEVRASGDFPSATTVYFTMR